ncbi:MAG TPA: hypothetical protein DDX01_03640, partial [Holosporales bacterium]|nr:hypothetical protein [Holosporales bacterium]
MTTEIKVNVKAGLVTTIANSVYSSALMKVRESISNSIDSKATRCLFFFKVCDENGENISKLSLLDNGHGITTDRFVEIFESIGCGLERLDANAYSYFGLGLMSIFKLGKKVSIVSKSEDGEIKKVFIDSYNFFHKDNENKNIEELQEYISFEETDLVERNIISPLSDESFTTWFDGNPSTFTEIIVEELYPDDITELTSASFKDELRKIVPLKPRVDDPFFSHFTEVDQASVVALLDNDTFFPTIDYFHGLQDDETIVRLTKYFPIFNLHGKKFDLYKCEVTTDFAYYVVYSTKDLQPDSDT